MLDLFYTVDVELWCNGWSDIDRNFPDAFKTYIHGPTSRGNFGLPFQLRLLKDYGFTGVFFVEPLFSTRFGQPPLDEIVGLVRDSGQEVQLHLHTEWVDESTVPLVEHGGVKRQHLLQFALPDQTRLIAAGAELLALAGARGVNAFRAGNFGFNADTLAALAANRFEFDSSYNATMFGPESGVLPGVIVVDPIAIAGIHEYPMTVFRDGFGRLRHAQLTACSSGELEDLLWGALESGRKSFVILSHGFELLNSAMNRPDDVVVGRFRRLCAFLDRNRDSFRVRGFGDLVAKPVDEQPEPLSTSFRRAGARVVQQALRRIYG